MRDESALIRSDDVLSSDLRGEVVLLKPETGDCYSLTGAGAVIWRTATEPRCIDELAEAVCREYDVSPEQAMEDVEAFLAQLVGEGLIVRAAIA